MKGIGENNGRGKKGMILEKSRCFLFFFFSNGVFMGLFYFLLYLVHLCDDGQKDNFISLIPCFHSSFSTLHSAIVC